MNSPADLGAFLVAQTAYLVNLDALIEREDFEDSPAIAALGDEPLFKVEELERGRLYFKALRKPAFQRYTASWSPEMVVEFVRSFIDDELIPSVILWHSKSTGKVFIIDGAHRISALIAWVNDDYGDGELSKAFFGPDNIPPEQLKFAQRTRELMANRVGDFKRLLAIGLGQEPTTNAELRRRGLSIATRKPTIQKVGGNADTAEKAFLTINEKPAIIDKTELDVIRARVKPNTIAARALMQAGRGYPYWGRFPDKSQEITTLAKEVFDLLFGDQFEIQTQSADLPKAGQPYSHEAFKMILNLVNMSNGISPAMWIRGKKPAAGEHELLDDPDGSKTIECLNRVKHAAWLVTSNEKASGLGLDHAVYWYGSNGKFYPAAFLASIKLAQQLKDADLLFSFTTVRKEFEDFLVRHKSFIKDLGHAKGGGLRPVESLVAMHRTIYDCLVVGKSNDDEIVAELQANERFGKDLKVPAEPIIEATTKRRRVSKAVTNALVIRSVLENRERCSECGARLPPHARTKDHVTPQRLGGPGSVDNIAFAHPYCNTGYKEKKAALASSVPSLVSSSRPQ